MKTPKKFIVTVCNKDANGRENGDDYQSIVEARDRAEAARKVRACWVASFASQPKPRITVRGHA